MWRGQRMTRSSSLMTDTLVDILTNLFTQFEHLYLERGRPLRVTNFTSPHLILTDLISSKLTGCKAKQATQFDVAATNHNRNSDEMRSVEVRCDLWYESCTSLNRLIFSHAGAQVVTTEILNCITSASSSSSSSSSGHGWVVIERQAGAAARQTAVVGLWRSIVPNDVLSQWVVDCAWLQC